MNGDSYCLNCGTIFHVPPSQIRRGGGKYCSPKCYQIAKAKITPEERFWRNVDKDTCIGDICGCQKGIGHCWPWTKKLKNHKYGQFAMDGKWYAPSRAAFYFAHGFWPAPMGCHHCDNPPCCRPEHIYAGDWKQNSADALIRGQIKTGESRAKHGEENGRSILTNAQVEEICSLLFPSQRKIAQFYGVSEATISAIAQKKGHIKTIQEWMENRDC